MNQYLALLRGINVGGNNLIKMVDLRACIEALGFADVRTYIQSGNVIFSAEESDQARLTGRIETALSETFSYQLPVVVRSQAELQAIVAQAPGGFGAEPEAYRYDVIYLKEPLTATEAIGSVTTRAGVDQAWPGCGVLYFSRLIAQASHLNKIVSTPIYPSITIRNWNTTTRLLVMMEGGGG